jgi:flavin-dependent dehydrogenase
LGAHSTLKAAKLIAADGANSGIAESLGMNRARVLYSTGLCISYLMEGLKDYERSAFKSHMGLAYQSRAPLIIYPTVDDESRAYLYVPGNKDQPPEVTFKKVMSGSPLVPVLKDAKVINKTGCSVKMYSSMKVPYRGNVIVIGDAAAYVEVEVQGGLMCGFQAGNAVCKELAEESGFEQYAKWWQETFEFNSDAALQVAQGFALVPTYTDDELDYLFALTEDEVLEGSYSQYKSPKLMWGSILRHRERIACEQPGLYEKINNNNKLTLRDTF